MFLIDSDLVPETFSDCSIQGEGRLVKDLKKQKGVTAIEYFRVNGVFALLPSISSQPCVDDSVKCPRDATLFVIINKTWKNRDKKM